MIVELVLENLVELIKPFPLEKKKHSKEVGMTKWSFSINFLINKLNVIMLYVK